MNIKQKNTFRKSLLTLAIAGATSTSFIVSANNESADEMETITVTATRSPMSIGDSLATQTVITRAEIARIQPKSVLDLLSTVAGIDISTSGGRGQASSVYMRGANSDHTLFLLNGVRISSASLGSTNVQSIAPELIERIEIVKGPRAALWGSDAIGGVIQIFTRKLQSGEHFVSTSVGSEGYHMLNGGIGIEHGDGFTSISAEHEESDGFDAKDDSEIDDDGYSIDSLSINGQQNVSKALSLNWLAQVNQGDTEYDSSRANESEFNNHVWQLGANYQWQVNNISNTTQLNVSQNRTSNTNHGNGTSVDEGTLYDSRRNQVSLLNASKLSSWWELNFGADLYQEKLKGDAAYNITKRDTAGVFAHTMFNDDQLSYELALRFDDVEGIDSETTYNASVGYQLTASTHLSVATGTGFKAPTFNDLYYPLSGTYVGNKDLISETSKSYTFNIKSQFEQLSIEFNLYQTDIENLIDWSGKDVDNNTTPVNIDNVEIKGAELGANYLGLGGKHQFNVSYIKSEDAATGNQLDRRAKEHASYQFDTAIGEANFYLEAQYKGKRYDYLYGGTVVELASYSLINLAINYPVTNKFTVEAKINNVFDKDYKTVNGYFTQGRAVYFGISYQN